MPDTGQAPQPAMEFTASVERKPTGEDAATMTIEFLRARLLSERSVSKAARQRAEQLAYKVSELEERLEAEIYLRKRLEAARIEILSKYRAKLSTEYGDIFSALSGEYSPGGDQGIQNEDEDNLSVSDSSRQLNNDPANEDDAESDCPGREKGVLAWGRRKGSKKQQEKDSGTDWLARSISQRSIFSADGESSQRRWAGKSVRQIRKRESRSFDTNLEDLGQTQNSDSLDGSSRNDERDTEVERVLERQAELIEQFEAEEDAQRAWEAKFEKQKALSSNGTAEDTAQNNVESASDTPLMKQSESEADNNDTDATVVKNGNLSEAGISVNEDKNYESVPIQTLSREVSSTDNDVSQSKRDVSEEKISVESKLGYNECQGDVSQASQSLPNLSSGDLNISSKVIASDSMEGGKPNGVHTCETTERPVLIKKHLSSSFKFAVLEDPDQASSSSPEMVGFVAHKQEQEVVHQFSNSEPTNQTMVDDFRGLITASEQLAAVNETKSGLSTTISNGYPSSSDPDIVSRQKTNLEVELEAPSIQTVVDDYRRRVTASEPLPDANNGFSSGYYGSYGNNTFSGQKTNSEVEFTNDLMRIDRQLPSVHEAISMDRYRMDGMRESRQDQKSGQGPTTSNFPTQPEFRIQQSQYMADGRSLVSVPHAHLYEDADAQKNHRSLDGGFDRVADVLRALQIAKHQVQTSSDHSTILTDLNAARRIGYDGRNAFYTGSANFPPAYGPLPATHPSRGSIPGTFSGSGLGQMLNPPFYPQYSSRMPDRQNLWVPPPPPNGVHNSSNYFHYDARQHR